ncbi:MAG TPA: riboflavin biosynthesis protein RibF, partial [Lachnospiraceae bacterium]|nr:riboflavin biosynthesis protein RibF [Lachnospiraceae bacterium]
TNIGYKPTVGAETRKGVETYLFDFDEDLYGKVIEVELFAYERPEIKFATLEELKKQMEEDIIFAKKYFKV